jgi:CspA family cold shock protein
MLRPDKESQTIMSFVEQTTQHRQEGIVQDFDEGRGQGVITTNNGERVTVRYAAISGQGVRRLRPGDRVTFELEQGPRGLQAVHVVRG